METRRWPLFAGVALVLVACVAGAVAVMAAVIPRPDGVSETVLAACGVACAAVIWTVGGRLERGLRGWRLIALCPLFPVLGAVTADIVAPGDPLGVLVVRWIPTVPGYLLAIAGGLTLVDRERLRDRGGRVAIELALFATAALVVVQFLVLGPAGRWSDFPGVGGFVLAAGVSATSLSMAAALTVIGVIESRRQRSAWFLLAGSTALTVGRGLATSALLHSSLAATLVARALVLVGLALVVCAVFADPGRHATRRGRSGGGATRLGQLLPHLAMVAAVLAMAIQSLAGRRPSALIVTGVLLCVLLAAAHRGMTARDEQRLGLRLRRSEAWFRSLVQSGSDAVVLLDDRLCVSWASPALDAVLGSAAAGLVGRPILSAVHPDDAARLAAALPSTADRAEAEQADRPRAAAGRTDAERADGEREGTILLRLAAADGTWHMLEAGVADQRADPHLAAVVLHCRDMTDRHAREQVLHSVAYSDPVTGLPNRAGCLSALERDLATDDRPVSLMLVELEDLQHNRAHAGREEVSAVVAEIGRRLRATVRAEDLVARIGASVFAVLVHGTEGDPAEAHAAEVDQLAARCLAVVEQPVVTCDGLIDLTASVGLAAGAAELSVEDVLTRAELALHAARDRATGTAARFTPALGEAAARRSRLRQELAGARDRGELFVLFEPIVSLSEQRVVGVEALLRWRHPALGDVPPAEFIPAAERAGLMVDLHRWVLAEATRHAAELATTADPIRLGVNVPTGYVAAGTLVGDVQAALAGSGLPPERLVLEIDEGAVLTDDERIGLDLATLRLMGVHVALQGFGTGYSALTHLTRLPIDVLKLDRALVSQLDRDSRGRALLASVVGIGRSLGLDVVAEGVETPAQLAALCLSGCGFAQGFLISRPMRPAQVADLLADGIGSLWPGRVGSR